MCGIAGIVALNPELLSLNRLKTMTDTLAHRGPDGEGQWIDEQHRVGLGHRRLSILDLSDAAGQPMHYLDRYSIVFNAEIYNYIELRASLIQQGYTFRTEGDTEVLMALFDRYGADCLPMLDGMFAFALFDKSNRKLFCARDRFGEKPFFYHHVPGKHFLFASEMKALWTIGVERNTDPEMLYNYMADGFLDDPKDASRTFFPACKKLPHAHWLLLDTESINFKTASYYSVNWHPDTSPVSRETATEQFRELLTTSVKRRLRSDVPVGSSLSGGLDSSLVVCLIDQLIGGTGQVQKTFSAVFPGFEKDESRFIQLVHQQTRAVPFFVSPDAQMLESEIDRMLYHQEEPVGSASIFVQYCVMRLAKEHQVTVLLDGQGADEILAGYHFFFKRFFYELSKSDPAAYQSELKAYQQLMQGNTINQSVHNGWKDRVSLLLQPVAPKLQQLNKRFQQQRTPVFTSDFFQAHHRNAFAGRRREHSLNEALYNALFTKGLQELLRYADRNSMAHSREVRVPFLYHELVDFLFRLPATYKIHDGYTKWVMRSAFTDLLPEPICWRRDKIGYEPPQKNWLNTPFIQERMRAAREQLIQNRILHPSVAHTPLESHAATQSGFNNWRMWMAAKSMDF